MTTRDRVLAALRKHGLSTALELQYATGIAATSIRPVLAGAQCEAVGWKGEGRQRQRVFRIKGGSMPAEIIVLFVLLTVVVIVGNVVLKQVVRSSDECGSALPRMRAGARGLFRQRR